MAEERVRDGNSRPTPQSPVDDVLHKFRFLPYHKPQALHRVDALTEDNGDKAVALGDKFFLQEEQQVRCMSASCTAETSAQTCA